MIKSIEELCQLKNVFRKIGRLGSCNALIDHVRRLRRRQPQLPDFVPFGAIQIVRKIIRRNVASYVSTENVWIESTLPKNVACTNHRILCVRPGLTFKTQSLLEIERNHGRLGELQHEIT